MISHILLISFLDRCTIVAILKGYILKFGREGGVTAVVRPVGIQHTDLCHRRISVLFLLKIVLNM